MEPIITAANLSRSFRNGGTMVDALKNVNITVEPAALTIFKGRSGSGKTTLLNLIGALDKPSSGEIIFRGTEITGLSEGKRDDLRRCSMGFVFQSIALISMMSAYENAEFGLRLAEYPSSERKKRAEECLSFVGLHKRMNHRIHELSGGEQQRVAIARAIAHKPVIIFADEPTASLDTHMGLQVMKLLKDHILKEGITVVMTSHDPNIIELADCVYSLQDGEVVDVL